MNSLERLSNDEQFFQQSMVVTFREVERNTEWNLRTRTGLAFANFTSLVALHEIEDGILHIDKICDRLEWGHSRTLLHTSRLGRRGPIHTENHGEDSGSDCVVILASVGWHVFTEAAPNYVDTVREEVISPLINEDREVMLRCLRTVLGRK